MPAASKGPRIALQPGESYPEDADGFHIYTDDLGLMVKGINARSVLYGTYRLIDWLRGDRDNDILDLKETAHFIERWMTATLHGRTDSKKAFRYLSRLGVNTAYLRGRRDALREVKHLVDYAADTEALPAISKASPPHEDIIAMARGAYGLAQAYDMHTVMFLDEPVAIPSPKSKSKEKHDGLPPSLLKKLPADMLGDAHCLRYRNDGWKALNVVHRDIHAHYKSLLAEVFKIFPKLRTFYIYNDDAGAANIHPPSDPDRQGPYPDGYDGYPWMHHSYFTHSIHSEAQKFNIESRSATATYHWYQDKDLRRNMLGGMLSLSVLLTLAAWDASADTTLLPEWTQDLYRIALERQTLVLVADDDFTGTSDDLLMETTAGFPMPHRTWRKLHTWAKAGATGITQHHTGGPSLGLNSITDLAWREFSWRPLVDENEAEARILRLLQQQLGDAAAESMMVACREVDKALDAVEAQVDNRPYASRLGHSHMLMFPPHLKHGLRREGVSTAEYIGDDIDPVIWQQALEEETAAHTAALAHAAQAVEAAPEDQSPFHLPFPDSDMSCREYAQVMTNALAIVAAYKRTFLNFLKAEFADDAELPAIWQQEQANMEGLVSALRARRAWIQSPSGSERLEKLIQQCEDKISMIERSLP